MKGRVTSGKEEKERIKFNMVFSGKGKEAEKLVSFSKPLDGKRVFRKNSNPIPRRTLCWHRDKDPSTAANRA